MIDSKVAVYLKRGIVYFNEFSFYEYKNICKMLLSNDIDDITNCFNRLLERVEAPFTLNVIDKYECLLAVRTSILGNEIELNLGERNVSFNIKEHLTGIFEESEFSYGECTFKTPRYFKHSAIQQTVADYLHSYKDNVISDASIDDKIKVLDSLDLPIIKISNEIQTIREDATISVLNDIVDINVYESNILLFIKQILVSDLMDLYNFEYSLNRHLTIKANDLKYYTYPELRINLNLFMKEKEDEKNSGSNSKPIE